MAPVVSRLVVKSLELVITVAIITKQQVVIKNREAVIVLQLLLLVLQDLEMLIRSLEGMEANFKLDYEIRT